MLSERRLVGDIEKHKSILVCIFRRQLKNSASSAINNCQYDYKKKRQGKKFQLCFSAHSTASQNSLLVSGVLAMSAETFASRLEKKLTSEHHIDAAVDITTLPAARYSRHLSFSSVFT